jgi:DNA repair exonuclease SbcCD ATPase subunit
LEEEDASREEMRRDLDAAAAELTASEKELADAKATRESEHRTFEQNEAVFVESIDQLERSLEVLAQHLGGNAEGGASLLGIAKNLQKTFQQGTDFSLSAAQKDTLEQFLRVAKKKVAPSKGQTAMAPDFLQVRQEPDDEQYGDYESQSSPVVTTLQGVLDKTKENKQAAMQEEERAAAAFSELEEQLKEQIRVATERMSTLKTQISASEERSSQMQADLLAANELLKGTKEHLEVVKADFDTKTQSFKARAVKRSDETVAVKEAIQALTGEAAKRLMSRQTIGTPDFLQLKQDTHRKVLHVIHSAPTPGLALLAMRTRVTTRNDPFAKVKDMVREMLEKLQSEGAEEAEHHAFCESEMGKSTKSKKEKEHDVKKLTERLESWAAEITKLTDEIAQTKQDLADMREAMQKSTEVRTEEEARATASIKEYQDAQILLTHAIKTLKEYYNKEAANDNASTEGSAEVTGERNREGLGGGVVAILEIAKEDFAELEKNAQLEENKSGEMYKEMTQELEIRTATFEKDLEYKSRTKVKLEAETSRTTADKESYEKELSAVNEYLEKLKDQCIAKAEPYEERKARREKELESLKEALDFLNGDGMA